MNSIYTKQWKSPLGELVLGVYNEQICLCDWQYRKMRLSIDNRLQQTLNATIINKEHQLHHTLITQLNEYFEGQRKEFNIPIKLVGTNFQINIWNLLLQIPYGKTCSYAELSKKYGNEKATRAVATANGANAISIIIPCHRVIGSNGTLVGYAGGLSAKSKLLKLEGYNPSHQISLF